MRKTQVNRKSLLVTGDPRTIKILEEFCYGPGVRSCNGYSKR